MKFRNWRTALTAVLSLAIFNTGMIGAAQAGIVDTAAMVQTNRDASMATIQAQLAREDVRAQMDHFGVDAASIDQRLAQRQ